MSGHSHWAGIKRQKGANDAKRGQIFTKLVREITIAAREGGSTNPGFNPRLRLAVQKARDNAMPNEIIDRTLKKIAGGEGVANLEEIRYEGYGAGGTAIMVTAFTDNRNRTSSEIRAVFSHHGGNLGEAGSVGWLFDRKGVITIEGEADELENIALSAIDAGADDFTSVSSTTLEVYTTMESLEKVREALANQGAKIVSAEISMVPKNLVDVDERTASQVLRLLEKLDDLDDVQQVYTNVNFPDAVLQKAS